MAAATATVDRIGQDLGSADPELVDLSSQMSDMLGSLQLKLAELLSHSQQYGKLKVPLLKTFFFSFLLFSMKNLYLTSLTS